MRACIPLLLLVSDVDRLFVDGRFFGFEAGFVEVDATSECDFFNDDDDDGEVERSDLSGLPRFFGVMVVAYAAVCSSGTEHRLYRSQLFNEQFQSALAGICKRKTKKEIKKFITIHKKSKVEKRKKKISSLLVQ